MKAEIAHKHKLATGKVQGQRWSKFGRRALVACDKVLYHWHLSLTSCSPCLHVNTKQGKVVITLDGRTQSHRGLGRAKIV